MKYQPTQEASEYAFCLQAISVKYNLHPSEIRAILGTYAGPEENVRFVKSVPLDLPFDFPVPISWQRMPRSAKHLSKHVGFSRPEGLVEYELRCKNDRIRFWAHSPTFGYCHFDDHCQIYFIEAKNLKKFYRANIVLSRHTGNSKSIDPILPEGMLKEIYDNSIGFLERNNERKTLYKEYQIPYKRGILLCGDPGNGKTTVCKWMRSLAEERGLATKVVTMQTYIHAKSHGILSSLFMHSKDSPGIIFFDDMDIMVQDRKTGNSEIFSFLTELDGINKNEGAVFVFTTNLIRDLDEAFVRPGRIDLFLTFMPPTAPLRKKYVETIFHKEILKQIDVPTTVERSKEYSFAELDEIRKLLTFDHLDGKAVSLDNSFALFDKHRKEFSERKIGFGQLEEQDDDDDLYGARALPFS